MSVDIASRLEELDMRRTARRRRVAVLRDQSWDSIATLRRSRSGCSGLQDRPMAYLALSMPESAEENGAEFALGARSPYAGESVLRQVREHLNEVDSAVREHWTEDDDIIVEYMHYIWEAAVRKGYTLEELRSILEALGPDG